MDTVPGFDPQPHCYLKFDWRFLDIKIQLPARSGELRMFDEAEGRGKPMANAQLHPGPLDSVGC